MATLPPDGFYSDVVNGFYGNLTTAGKNLLWQEFLTQEGITSVSPAVIDNVPTEQDFIAFIQNSIRTTGTAALSPDEILKRTAMLAAFDLALKMLTALQNSVIVQSNSLQFYTEWQNEYTTMMASVPSYLASPTTGISRPSSSTFDPTTFTFGYDNISVQNIADYIVSNNNQNSNGFVNINSTILDGIPGNNLPGSPNQFGIDGLLEEIHPGAEPAENVNPSRGITLTPTAGTSGITLTFASTLSQGTQGASLGQDYNDLFVEMDIPASFTVATGSFLDNVRSDPNLQVNHPIYLGSSNGQQYMINENSDNSLSIVAYAGPATVDATNTASVAAQNISDAFEQLYYNYLGNPISTNDAGASPTANPPTVYDANSLPNIPWSLTGTDPDTIKLRAEVNTELQQYIENIRSYRQAIQDTATNVQTNLSSTNQAINQQDNLLSSIVTTMQTIIGTMFQ